MEIYCILFLFVYFTKKIEHGNQATNESQIKINVSRITERSFISLFYF